MLLNPDEWQVDRVAGAANPPFPTQEIGNAVLAQPVDQGVPGCEAGPVHEILFLNQVDHRLAM